MSANEQTKPCPFCGEKATAGVYWGLVGCFRCGTWQRPAEWNLRIYPDTPRKLADFLVAHGLIDPAAVNDPEGYDAGRTMALIAQAAEGLCVPDTIHVTQRMDREKFLACKPKKELGW